MKISDDRIRQNNPNVFTFLDVLHLLVLRKSFDEFQQDIPCGYDVYQTISKAAEKVMAEREEREREIELVREHIASAMTSLGTDHGDDYALACLELAVTILSKKASE